MDNDNALKSIANNLNRADTEAPREPDEVEENRVPAPEPEEEKEEPKESNPEETSEEKPEEESHEEEPPKEEKEPLKIDVEDKSEDTEEPGKSEEPKKPEQSEPVEESSEPTPAPEPKPIEVKELPDFEPTFDPKTPPLSTEPVEKNHHGFRIFLIILLVIAIAVGALCYLVETKVIENPFPELPFLTSEGGSSESSNSADSFASQKPSEPVETTITDLSTISRLFGVLYDLHLPNRDRSTTPSDFRENQAFSFYTKYNVSESLYDNTLGTPEKLFITTEILRHTGATLPLSAELVSEKYKTLFGETPVLGSVASICGALVYDSSTKTYNEPTPGCGGAEDTIHQLFVYSYARKGNTYYIDVATTVVPSITETIQINANNYDKFDQYRFTFENVEGNYIYKSTEKR